MKEELSDKYTEASEYGQQSMVKRTIVDLIDVETGEMIDANDLLENDATDKAVFQKIRETLIAAEASRSHKYVCAICMQPVRLNSKVIADSGRTSNYFSHFSFSSDCPIKTTSGYDPDSFANRWYQHFKTTATYRHMSRSLETAISRDKRFTGLSPDLISTFDGKAIQFSFQLYTTFIGRIHYLENSHRADGSFLVWLFPSFSRMQQEMCARDIYYGHHRNVFVFDCEAFYRNGERQPSFENYDCAFEASLKSGRFMLNCFWQEPVEKDGALHINWRHRLVDFSDLVFDDDKKDLYYYDSDKEFYRQSDPRLQFLISQWDEKLRLYWRNYEAKIQLRKSATSNRKYLSAKEKHSRKLQQIIDKVKAGGIISSFYGEQTDKKGFMIDDEEFIPAKYYIQKDFDENGIAIVRNSIDGKCGGINYADQKIFNMQYTEIRHLDEDLYVLTKDRVCGLFNSLGEEILPIEYPSISLFCPGYLLIHCGSYFYSRSFNGYSRYGNPIYSGSWVFTDEGKKIVTYSGEIVISGFNDYMIIDGGYILAKGTSKNSLFDIEGNLISERFLKTSLPLGGEILGIDCERKEIFYKRLDVVYVFDFEGNQILSKEGFSSIQASLDGGYDLTDDFGTYSLDAEGQFVPSETVFLSNGYYKVKAFRWSIFKDNGELLTKEQFFSVGDFKDHSIIVADLSGSYTLLNEEGHELLKHRYSNLEDAENGLIKAQMDRHTGYLDRQGAIISKKILLDDNRYYTLSFDKFQLYDTQGNKIGERPYELLEDLGNGFFRVKHYGDWDWREYLLNSDAQEIGEYKSGILNILEGVNDPDSIYFDKDDKSPCLEIDYQSKSFRINRKGRLIPNKTERLSNGYWKGAVGDKWYLFDSNGSLITDRGFVEIGDYMNGSVVTKFSDFSFISGSYKTTYNWSLMDERGEDLYVCSEPLVETNDGLICFENQSGKQYLKRNGQPIPSSIEPLSKSIYKGLFDGQFALLNQEMVPITGFDYTTVSFVDENRFLATKNDGEQIILDSSGNTIFSTRLSISIEGNGELCILDKGHRFIIDDKGQISPVLIDDTHKNYDIYYDMTHYFISNKDGKFFIHQYDMVKSVGDDWIIVSKNGQCGLKDSSGKILIDFRPQKIEYLGDNRFKTTYKYDKQIRTRGRYGFNWVYKNFTGEKIITIKTPSDYLKFELGKQYDGTVEGIKPYGVFVRIKDVGTALLHISKIKAANRDINSFYMGQHVKVEVAEIDYEKKRANLSIAQ